MIVVRHVAVQSVVRSEIVDEVLLVVINGYPKAVNGKPVQRLVRVKLVLRIISERILMFFLRSSSPDWLPFMNNHITQ